MKIACQGTYATLCVYSDSDPQLARVLQEVAGLTASRTVENKLQSFGGFKLRRYGWFLTSKDQLDSLDVADHIWWICKKIKQPEAIASLVPKYDISLSCFWSSDGGGGGPVLPKNLLSELGRIGIDLDFDLYLGSNEVRH
jgi:hypothetical protein